MKPDISGLHTKSVSALLNGDLPGADDFPNAVRTEHIEKILDFLRFPRELIRHKARRNIDGLGADEPAIGVILSEAMQYLSMGYWWLAVLPGLALVAVVIVFDRLGSSLRDLVAPDSAQV